MDMSSNDTDQEEVGGRMRGNKFAAHSEAWDDGQHFDMTSDHLFPVLEKEADLQLLAQVGSCSAVGNVPDEIIDAIRMGHVTALRKPDGGAVDRGRRHCDVRGRWHERWPNRSSPFQYALSTKAGCECIARVQSITDRDPEATCAACGPLRVASAHTSVEEELFTHANIRVHHGKTQVWNRGVMSDRGTHPSCQTGETRCCGVEGRSRVAPRVESLGSDFLEKKRRDQEVLLNKIPGINNPQALWVLLLMCASTRANFWLREVRPKETKAFADRHDANVEACLRRILGMGEIPAASQILSTLALSAHQCTPFHVRGSLGQLG